MTERPPSYRVLAVRYAERQTTFSEAYYRWSTYGEPDGPLQLSYYFWILDALHEPGSPPIVLDCGFEPERGAHAHVLGPIDCLEWADARRCHVGQHTSLFPIRRNPYQ